MPESLKKYSDRVLGYLRDAYGIDAEVQHGGKHPCIAFNWQGVNRRIALRHDGGAHGFDMKRQDIRRVLGAPPATTGETAMVMIETTMPHQVAAPPPYPLEVSEEISPATAAVTVESRSCRGLISAHASNGCLQFRFPKDASPFAVGTELTAERFGEGWLIVSASHKGTGRHSKLREQGQRAFLNVMMRPAGIAKPFHAVEAEYVIGDGQILVSPQTDDLSAYLVGEPPAPPLTNLPAEGWKPPPPCDGLTAAEMRGERVTKSTAASAVDWPESRIREVLAMVRAIEAAGFYRIEREADGTLAFVPQIQVIR